MINLNNDVKSHIFSYLTDSNVKVRRLEPDGDENFLKFQVSLITSSGRPLNVLNSDLAKLMCVCKEFNEIVYNFCIDGLQEDLDLKISDLGQDFRYLFYFQQTIRKAPSEFTGIDKLRYLKFLVDRAKSLASASLQDDHYRSLQTDLQEICSERNQFYWSSFVDGILHSAVTMHTPWGDVSMELEDINLSNMLRNSDLDLTRFPTRWNDRLDTIRYPFYFREVTVLTDPYVGDGTYRDGYRFEDWPMEITYCKNLKEVRLCTVSVQIAKEWKKHFPKLHVISGFLRSEEELPEFRKFAHENRMWFVLQEAPYGWGAELKHYIGPYGYQDSFRPYAIRAGDSLVRVDVQGLCKGAKIFFWRVGCESYDFYRQHPQVVVAIAVCIVAGAVLAAWSVYRNEFKSWSPVA